MISEADSYQQLSIHNSPQRNVLPSLIFPEESVELGRAFEDEAEAGQNTASSHTQTCRALPRTEKAKNNFHVRSSILQIKGTQMHVLHKTFQRLCVVRYEIKLMANMILCKHNYQDDGMY